MPLAEDNDMIEAITSDRADEPLRISILPRRVSRDRPIPDAHGPHALNEPGAVNAVPITDHVLRRISPGKRVSELPQSILRLDAQLRGEARDSSRIA